MEGGIVERVRMTSTGIKGDGDRDRLEGDLGAEEGVRNVRVDPSSHTVEIAFDPTILDTNLIRTRVEAAGYKIDSQEAGIEPTSTGL